MAASILVEEFLPGHGSHGRLAAPRIAEPISLINLEAELTTELWAESCHRGDGALGMLAKMLAQLGR
jgi:hypothetical protein